MPRTVSAAFDELLGRVALTPNQVDTASARHIRLRDFLKSKFNLAEDPWLTGSYSRKTIIRQDRDIDVMAAMSVREYWPTYQTKSSGLVNLVRDALNKQYGSSDVSSSGAAVIMSMDVFQVDVVPVIARDGGGYLVANGQDGWKATNPAFHFELMEQHNKTDALLKPLVKLLKYWNICNDELIQSFHLEMMIEKMWRGASIGNHPHGLKETLRVLIGYVAGAFDDPWAPGGRIDTHLVGDALKKATAHATSDAASAAAAEELRAAGNDRAAFVEWQKVFRGEFPAFG